eukprot:g31575.t1
MVLGKRDSRLTSCQSLACGALAGLLSRSLTCPLDVVKVLSQVGTFHSKRGFLRTFRIVLEAEGLRALWKGNGVACVRLFPYSTVQLSAYNRDSHASLRIQSWACWRSADTDALFQFRVGHAILYTAS